MFKIRTAKVSFAFAIIIFFCPTFGYAQTNSIKTPDKKDLSKSNSPTAAKSTAAFAEILLRKTERESELEELLLDYQEEFPKIQERRFELGLLQKYLDRLLAVNAAQAEKLTLALGKLIVRKVEIETDLWNLRRQYNDENPEVKRTKRKLEIYERAIKEIL